MALIIKKKKKVCTGHSKSSEIYLKKKRKRKWDDNWRKFHYLDFYVSIPLLLLLEAIAKP